MIIAHKEPTIMEYLRIPYIIYVCLQHNLQPTAQNKPTPTRSRNHAAFPLTQPRSHAHSIPVKEMLGAREEKNDYGAVVVVVRSQKTLNLRACLLFSLYRGAKLI